MESWAPLETQEGSGGYRHRAMRTMAFLRRRRPQKGRHPLRIDHWAASLIRPLDAAWCSCMSTMRAEVPC
eukprot:2688288-Pyramimonas_sp.AAC.1